MGLKYLYQYLGQNEELRKASDFWNWFELQQSGYLFINEVAPDEKERLLDELMSELHRFNEHLYYEIGGNASGEQLELILSAGGMTEHFPAVELLADLAPSLKNWQVIRFKPPMGSDFQLEIGGRIFDPNQIQFIPLQSEKNPHKTGILVCYPDYSDEHQQLFLQGTHLLLDTLLGEKSAAMDIHHLEIGLFPEAAAEFETKPLSEIGSYIAGKRKGRP